MDYIFSVKAASDALREAIAHSPSAMQNSHQLRALLKDVNPNGILETNLLMIAYDANIMTALSNVAAIDSEQMRRFINTLTRDYGIKQQYAKDTVMAICDCFTVRVPDLSMPCSMEVSFPDDIEAFLTETLPCEIAKGEEVSRYTLLVNRNIKMKKLFVERFIKACGKPFRNLVCDNRIRSSEMASMLTNLNSGDVLYFNGITLNLPYESMQDLYNALIDNCLDLLIGKGASARSIRLDLPKFSFLVCVDRMSNTLETLLPAFTHVFQNE